MGNIFADLELSNPKQDSLQPIKVKALAEMINEFKRRVTQFCKKFNFTLFITKLNLSNLILRMMG